MWGFTSLPSQHYLGQLAKKSSVSVFRSANQQEPILIEALVAPSTISLIQPYLNLSYHWLWKPEDMFVTAYTCTNISSGYVRTSVNCKSIKCINAMYHISSLGDLFLRWANKTRWDVRPYVRTYVRVYVRMYVPPFTMKLNGARWSIVEWIEVDETNRTI